jgi:hypothetical protein
MKPIVIKTNLNLSYAKTIVDAHEAFIVPRKPPKAFIKAICNITKYSLNESSLHTPTITHFKGNIKPHKDSCGLANFLVMKGIGYFITTVDSEVIKLKVSKNDIVIFDDTIEHSFESITKSVQVLVFNIISS